MAANLLLRLPGELRNRIYYDVINHDRFENPGEVLLLQARETPDGRTEYKVEPSQPRLAAASRQVRHEVLSLFLGQKRYSISLAAFGGDPASFERWMQIARHSLWYLRKVTGVFYIDSLPRWEAHLNRFRATEYVVIDVDVTETGSLALTYIGDDFASREGGARSYCRCVVTERARAAEAGLIGSSGQTPLIRFFQSWAKSHYA